MVPACCLGVRRAQRRNNGNCPSSPCSEAIQFSFFLYISGALSPSLNLPTPGWAPTSPVHRPFKSTPGFPAAFRFTHGNEIPADFHSQMLNGYLLLAVVLQVGETSVGLGLLASLELREPSWFSTATRGCGAGPFCISALWPVSSGCFFTSLVLGLLVSLSSDGCPGCLFYNLVLILIWSWEGVSTVFTYLAISFYLFIYFWSIYLLLINTTNILLLVDFSVLAITGFTLWKMRL